MRFNSACKSAKLCYVIVYDRGTAIHTADRREEKKTVLMPTSIPM